MKIVTELGSKVIEQSSQWRLALKMRLAFSGHDYSFISSNCLGGRFSQILGMPYRSPTVGMYFEPQDYLSFITDLPDALAQDIKHDADASLSLGYPVARLKQIRLHLMHYADFDTAKARWDARKTRVNYDHTFFIFTDRDGASYAQLQAFDALPDPRKIMFVHKPYPELRSAIYVSGDESAPEVCELYSQWHRLNSALPMARLHSLAKSTPSTRVTL